MENEIEQKEEWYSQKDLFEMVMDLKKDLHETRLDIRKYNDLRKSLAELQSKQVEIINNRHKELGPEGATSVLRKELYEFRNEWAAYINQKEGKKTLKDAFLQWGGWSIALISVAIALLSLIFS